MENTNTAERSDDLDLYERELLTFDEINHQDQNLRMDMEGVEDAAKTAVNMIESTNSVDKSSFNQADGMRIILEDQRHYQEVDDRGNDKESVEVEIGSASETLSDKMSQLDSLLKTETQNFELNSCEGQGNSANHVKKLLSLSETYTDSSHSSSSEQQFRALPFESSNSSQENHPDPSQGHFENSIQSQMTWKESNLLIAPVMETQVKVESAISVTEQVEKETFPSDDVVVIKTEENTQPTAPSNGDDSTCFLAPGFPPSVSQNQLVTSDTQVEVKTETTEQQPNAEPVAVPVIPPTPRKRGRPRKQILPNPSPLVESWGPNVHEFPSLEPPQEPKEERKRSCRSERRQAKKKKMQHEEIADENSTKKRKPPLVYQKKKRRSTYVPKKKLPPAKKKQSEIENFQNFEEETRMSATEVPTGFSSKPAATGDESQGSSATDGPTRSNINKKGRMEVASDGCKPVTVQQIVEYHWPPPSSSQGDKSEALMIQEQITEYLGVKSFKRKYPSIKRRPVDMEERTYLQENGFVSENMCDLGLTAVFAADIIEIMYNDFPHKFDEYRKYTREKKAKEQRALREKQAAERADMDPKKEAIESALSWNSDFNKTRREKRASCFDLQTFTVHFPTNRFKKISLGKPGHYPIALIPGQNTDYYKSYTSNELKYFPLNTVLYGPLRPNERHLPIPSGSDGSQSEIDDSSSSDDSSSTSSEETQDTEETNSTIEEEINSADIKIEKFSESEEKDSKPAKGTGKTPKGRGRGKVSSSEQKGEPKKRLGRPPKLKLASIKLKRVDVEEALKEEKLDISSRVIIHTCKMCHEEESKNKNGEHESFIECAQCKGKIHPSCIDLTADMIPKISSYGWQCTDCKSCVKCDQSSNEDKMIFCDQCDRGYHIYCVGLGEVPSGNYICVECKPNTSSEEPPTVEENDTEVVENGEGAEGGAGAESGEEAEDAQVAEVKEEPPEMVKAEVKVEEENMEKRLCL